MTVIKKIRTKMANAVETQKSDWQAQVPGKWILFGEHAVLRGSQAIVFPLRSRFLDLSYLKSSSEFNIQITGLCASDLEMIIWSVMEKALSELGIKRSDLKGDLNIHSNIQFGAGMGASATLAVGLTLFFQHLGVLKVEPFLFAKKLEDLFHGESSGVDVAVALHQKPLIFEKNKENIFFDLKNLPLLYLSYTGQRGVTKDCVTKVKKLISDKPEQALAVDARMKSVAQDYIKAHFEWTESEWIEHLNKAQSCFESWDLVPVAVEQHIQTLKKAGALACKLTGSGNGGYVLSLWSEKPKSEDLAAELIPVF
jgi:mevalonate kinase